MIRNVLLVLFLAALIGGLGWSGHTLMAAVKQESEGVNIGYKAPNFKVYNSRGEQVSLSDYRGQFLLVNFWAWWCPPCIAEMKSLYELEKKLEGKVKFLYIGINLFYRDDKPLDPGEIAEGYRPSLEKFLAGLNKATLVKDDPEKNKIVVDHLAQNTLFDFRGYWERQFRARTNERYGIPVTYLIDGEGRIRMVVHTYQDWLKQEDLLNDFSAGKDLSKYADRFIIPPELRPKGDS